MQGSDFPRKYGAAWTAPGGRRVYAVDWDGLTAGSYADVSFAERAQEGVHLPYTWHVDRGKFDLMLLKHASSLGADVHCGVKVQDVDMSDTTRPLKEEGDYSYAMEEICGDGFVLIGDAARFVDPIFSTGVSIALNSARFAAHDVIEGLQNGNGNGIRKAAFRRYEETLRRGTKN